MNTPQNRIYAIKSTAAAVALTVTVLAFGFTHEFSLFRTATGVLIVLFSFLLFLNKDRYAYYALIPAFVFLPVLPLYPPRHIWIMIDIATIVAVFYFAYRSTNSYEKGIRFEQYVADMFPQESFDIVDRTRDISKFTARRVESASHPDFIFRSKRTGKEFAVECKWRSNWFDKKGIQGLMWEENKRHKYMQFGKQRNMPVFIAFGIGGSPELPDKVYFIEVERTHYVFLEKRLLESGRKIEEMQGL